MVLIISEAKKKAQVISDIFYYMGVISYAVTPTEAMAEFSGLYRSVIILEPQELPDQESLVSKLRAYSSATPIFSISDSEAVTSNLFDGYYGNSVYSSTLVEEIVRYQHNRNLPLTAYYRVAGIDASCDRKHVTVFDKPISFTKTETMILRYLIASYPAPQTANSIIKHAYRPYKKPELASIRTHISVMNKKFRKITGKNLFIGIEKEGYAISTPEIIKILQSV